MEPTSCWRCEARLRDVSEVDAESETPDARLKCACCRRLYPLEYFSGNQRNSTVLAKRCPGCSSGGKMGEILKEDEFFQAKEARDAKRNAKRRRVDPKWSEKANARAESRAKRNFRKQLDRQVEAKFERERSKIRDGLLEEQRQARKEAEQLAKELETEVKQMEERGEIPKLKPAKKRKRS